MGWLVCGLGYLVVRCGERRGGQGFVRHVLRHPRADKPHPVLRAAWEHETSYRASSSPSNQKNTTHPRKIPLSPLHSKDTQRTDSTHTKPPVPHLFPPLVCLVPCERGVCVLQRTSEQVRGAVAAWHLCGCVPHHPAAQVHVIGNEPVGALFGGGVTGGVWACEQESMAPVGIVGREKGGGKCGNIPVGGLLGGRGGTGRGEKGGNMGVGM